MAGSSRATNVARWDGSNWFALGPGVNGPVSSLATLGGDLYVGGNFTSAGTLAVSNVARWDGSTWSSLASGLDGPVTVLASSGSNLYAGGWFSKAGSSSATNIALWDGNEWSALGEGVNIAPTGMTVIGSQVYVVSPSSTTRPLHSFIISKWNGNDWGILVSGRFDVLCCDFDAKANAMALIGNDIYICGFFSGVDGIPANCIAKWDGSKWEGLGSGLYSTYVGARALATDGSDLFVGGQFYGPGQRFGPLQNIALWHIPHGLSTSRSGTILTLAWPATGTNFVLEASDSLPATDWSADSPAPLIQGIQCVVTNELSGNQKFYRLRRR